MTKEVFETLDVYYDDSSRSAAMNMAIDEVLLETARVPSIRFYQWNRLALSFGYFGQFADVEIYSAERDLVRRWTGGGIVFHGNDLTYSIVIPAEHLVLSHSSISLYEQIHGALRDALIVTGERAELTAVAGDADAGAAVNDRGYNEPYCFAHPMRADVMLDGRKVAGAAQRRTRAGLLQQGSIQHVDLANGLAEEFAQALSPNCKIQKIDNSVLRRGQEIAEQKYGTSAWLRKR